MAGALREVFARFAFALDGKDKLEAANRGVDRVKAKAEEADSSFATLGAGLVSAFAGNALLSGLNHFAEQLDTLDDLSAQTGVATDALQVYGYAAQKSGASTEEFNASLGQLQKSLGKTTEASGAQVDALKALSIDTSQPRQLAEVLPEIFAGFSKLPTQAKKAEVATALFGRAGVRLIPTLERGTEGIADLKAELEESGGIVSADTIAKAGEYRDNLARLDRTMFAFKGTLAGAVFPQLSKVVEVVSKAIGGVSDFAKSTTLAENAGVALAASLAGPVLAAFKPFLGRGLKFAAVFAAVDEVLGFLNGKDSYIADLLNGAFGDGTADKVRDWVNDAIGNLDRFHSSAAETFVAIEDENAAWTTRALAVMAGFLRDAAHGFPIWTSSMRTVLNDMEIAINEFILSVMQKWNGLLDRLLLPDSITTVLKMDTAETEQGLQSARDKNLNEAYKRDAERRGVTPGSTRQGRSASAEEQAAFRTDANAAGEDFGPAAPTLEETAAMSRAARGESRTQRINRERTEALAAQDAAAPAAVTETLAMAAAAGSATAVLHDNKTVTINFAKGIGKEDKAAIQAAVQEALRTDNRAALEALTQKAPSK